MPLASLSEDLKIFNGDETFTLSVTVPVSKTPGLFSDITWSGDGNWIACTPVNPANDPLCVYKLKNNALQPWKYIPLTSIKSASFLNWTNRTMAIGTAFGDIYLWDLKMQKSNKIDSKQKQTVDHLSVICDDSMLASGSLNSAKIYLHSLQTNKVVGTLQVPNSEHTSALAFCSCKRTYLAASSYESVVSVWDVVRSNAVFKSVNTDMGTITGISFSPINYSVLSSVGLAKRFKMHDLRDKMNIIDVETEESIYSVEMLPKGDKVVLGTYSGSIVAFDLRNCKTYSEFKAHAGPVLALKRQRTNDKNVTTNFENVDMNTPEVMEKGNRTLDVSVIDVFSPIGRLSPSGFSATTISLLSTPDDVNEGNELTSSDSFMMKILSPKKENVLMSTPNTPKRTSFDRLMEVTGNGSRLDTVNEEPVESKDDTVSFEVNEGTEPETPVVVVDDVNGHSNLEDDIGDGIHNHAMDPSANSILLELRKMHNEQLESNKELLNRISLLENDLRETKSSVENLTVMFTESYNNLIQLLVNGIKEEIFTGNCDGKIEHTCQRLLMGTAIDRLDLILGEVSQYSQKINAIHSVLKKS